MKISRIHILIIVIITSLVYINILQNEFVWDDSSFIMNWYETRSLNINSFFKGSLPQGQEGVYRPLRSVFYSISYKLWHLNPIGYHIQSIIIHLISTILIYFITIKITKNNTIALMTSLLFGIHPIHIEAITFITTSFDIIGVIFFLLSFLLYLSSKNKLNYILSLFFALLAFFTYEMTLTLPLLIILYEFLFKKIKKENILRKIKRYSPYFIIALFYAFIRIFILSIGSRGNYLANSFYLTLLTMTKAFLKYISLTILPINLNTDHIISKGIVSLSYASLNNKAILAQSIFDMHILFSIAIIALLLIIGIIYLKKQPLIPFCIFWFFIALSPIANIIPQSSILTEKYLYISSFAFSLIFSFMIYSIYNLTYKHTKKIAITLFIIVLISFSILTISRNSDWNNSLTLWSKTVSQSPESVVAHNNLGKAFHEQGKLDLAIQQYKKTLTLNPNRTEAYNNLGIAYYEQGNLDLAIQQYKKAITIKPNYAEAYNNLGTTYQAKGNITLAINKFQKSITINPINPEPHYNLANAYGEINKISLAIQEYKKTITINQNHADAYNNLGIIYHQQGKLDLAIQHYKKALSINPTHLDALTNLRIALNK